MTNRHIPTVVYVVMVLLPAVGGILALSSLPSPPKWDSVCPGVPTQFQPPTYLTPANPVILPKCAQYSPRSGSIVFSVGAPVDLRGSWAASAPLAVAVFNVTTTVSYGWPCPGCYAFNGSFNSTLFPGTYEIAFDGHGATFVATQAILVTFDRSLEVLQPSLVTNLAGGNYSAWPIIAPPSASNFWLEGLIGTTGCSYTIAILPLAVFQAFLNDRGAVNSPGALLLQSGWASVCPSPPVSTAVGFGTIGPFGLTSGDTLVFYNSWGSAVQLTVLAPIEVSYLSAA